MPTEVSVSRTDRYGRGYHARGVTVCPHCGRETVLVTINLPNMGAKARKCPWCSQHLLTRMAKRLVRGVPDSNHHLARAVKRLERWFR